MTEADLQIEIIAFLRTVPRCWFNLSHSTHRNKPAMPGVPDLLVLFNGRFFGFELKVGRNLPTNIQSEQMEMIRRAGGYAGVARSLDDVTKAMGI